jgi:hypothetical protein
MRPRTWRALCARQRGGGKGRRLAAEGSIITQAFLLFTFLSRGSGMRVGFLFFWNQFCRIGIPPPPLTIFLWFIFFFPGFFWHFRFRNGFSSGVGSERV